MLANVGPSVVRPCSVVRPVVISRKLSKIDPVSTDGSVVAFRSFPDAPLGDILVLN